MWFLPSGTFSRLAPSPVLGITTALHFHSGPHQSCGTDPLLCSKVGHRLGPGQSEPCILPAPMTLPKDGPETQTRAMEAPGTACPGSEQTRGPTHQAIAECPPESDTHTERARGRARKRKRLPEALPGWIPFRPKPAWVCMSVPGKHESQESIHTRKLARPLWVSQSSALKRRLSSAPFPGRTLCSALGSDLRA